MSARTIAIGDVHGCSAALRGLIDAIAPTADDTLVFLGDYIDRGEDSSEVVEQILSLQSQCRVITLLGNHELMLLNVVCEGGDPTIWFACGGEATIASYGGEIDLIPERHIAFFQQCLRFWEDDANIYVHASYVPSEAIDLASDQILFWEHLPPVAKLPHCSGKRVIVGHTPQPNFQALVLEHLVCLDTCCFGGGWLTAMDVNSGQFWQAHRDGQLRRNLAQSLAQGARVATQSIGKLWTRRIV